MTNYDRKAHEIECLVSAYRSIFPSPAATYLAAPLTSGELYLGEKSGLAVRDALSRNRRLASEAAARIRLEIRSPVIDPTALCSVRGWAQSDYRKMWGMVIRESVHTIVFLNSWEFSEGCVHEFSIGLAAGLVLKDQSLGLLSPERASQLLSCAIDRLRRADRPSGLHQRVLQQVDRHLVKVGSIGG